MMSTLVSGHPSELSRSKRSYQDTRNGVFQYVSDHLIYEILLRTPAESLLVLKSVCKDWCSIIKDPNFIRQHCDHHMTKEQSIGLVSLLEREDCSGIYDLTNINKLCKTGNEFGNLERQNEQLQLSTHADGRLLKITSCNSFVCFHTEFPLHMWNPVTRELMMLPKPGIRNNKEVATGCGFGFDASHNEYKVIQLYKRVDDSTLGYEVLTLGTAMSWRRPIQQKDSLLHPNFWEFESGQEAIFVEGSLYWHATEHILCFDVTTERFELIQVPDRTHLKLGSYCELLVGFDRKSLCFMSHDETHEMLHLWKMQQRHCSDKKSIWIKGYSIDVSFISVPDTHITPVCIRGKKIYLRYGNGLACYDTESQAFVKAVFRNGGADCCEFVAYTKSIVCLKDIVGSSFVSSLEPNC